MRLDRRQLLSLIAGAFASWAVCAQSPAGSVSTAASSIASASSAPAERSLELTNTHTGENVKVMFRDAAGYVQDALAKLNHVLRDHRTDKSHEMDPALFDQLSDLALAAQKVPHYEIISGYRSPASNAKLRARSPTSGVAEKSLHMQGRAMDVRLKGLSCAELRDLALAARRGGVGYYEKSNFVHLDTGRVRTWVG
jgi:uncharacterized protein YcbK (DUF882 family)